MNVVPLVDGESISDVVALLAKDSSALPGEDRFVRFQFIREIQQSADHPYPAQVHINGEPQLIDGARSLVFTVIARAVLEAGSDDPVLGLDAAHALASHTFDRIITEGKHAAWGRIR